MYRLQPYPWQNCTSPFGSVELKAGIDYRVSYENNVQVGRASFTVTGQGNYTGSVSGGFAIVKVETEWTRNAVDPQTLVKTV